MRLSALGVDVYKRQEKGKEENMGDLFRKTSLEQAETPEKLDEYSKVTHACIWSVLIACFAIIVAVAVWLAVGRLSLIHI